MEYIDDVAMTNETTTVSHRTPIRITGWSLNTKQTTTPEVRALHLKGDTKEYIAPINSALVRSDVQRHLGLGDEYQFAGYAIQVDLGSVSRGTYELSIITSFPDEVLQCTNGRIILVQ